MRLCAPAGFVLVGLAMFASAPAIADELPPIRRLYLPADQLKELGERYPDLQSLRRDEFDELLRRARLNGEPILPLVESARLVAALDGDRIAGTAELVVRGKRDVRSMLRWPASPCAISNARWSSDAASIGYAGRGELGLVVPPGEKSTLAFDWAIATQSTEPGRQFKFAVPPSLSCELALDLPRGLIPADPSALVSGPTNAPRPELQRWSMRWSPADTVRCLLLKEGGSRQLAPLVVYRRDMEIDVAEESAELLARFDLFVAHQPIHRLEFECSTELTLVGWTGLKVHDFQERDGHIFLDLAEPLAGSAQLTMRAIGPGPSDGRWKLPRFEIVEGYWTGGTTRLQPAPGLNLYGPQVTAGRVVAVHGSGGNRPALTIEHEAADPGFTARVSAEQPEVFARIRSSIELGSRLAARVTASWQIASGEVTSLEVRLPPKWSLADVDMSPEGLLSRWSVGSQPDGQLATLRLNRPVSGETAITAVMHLMGPSIDESARSDELAIPRVQPVGVHAAEEILSIDAKPAWSAELVDTTDMASIARPSEPNPPASERPASLTYRFDGPHADGKLVVTKRAPELTATAEVNVDVTERETQVDYSLELAIANGSPESVDVHFHAPTGDGLIWDLPEGVRAERLDSDSRLAGAAEVWRVMLPSKSVPQIKLNATWQAARSDPTAIPLPAVAQATATAGVVVVTFPSRLELRAETTNLAVGPPRSDTESRTFRRPDTRQQVWWFATSSPQLAIRVGPRPNLLEAESRVAHTRLRTAVDSSGAVIHTVHYQIHSTPGTEVTLQIPAGATLRYARSNGVPITSEDDSPLRLRCPAGVDDWPVEIQYVSQGRPIRRWASLNFDLPTISMPSLRFSWELNAPANYAAVTWPPELIAAPPRTGKRGAERLFGPFTRESNAGLFRFWKAEAWRDWWATQTNPPTDATVKQLRESLDEFVHEGLPRDRTWARLIAQLDQSTGGRLVIDTIAISDVDVDLAARTDLDTALSGTFFGLARTAPLNLLRTRRGLFLTSREAAAELAATDDGDELRTLDGRRGLADAIDQATLHGADASGRFVLAADWARLAEPTDVRLSSRDGASALTGASWHFESLADPAVVSVTLIENALPAQAATAIVCVAIVVAFVRKSRPGLRWLGGWSFLTAAAFVLAVTVPDAFTAPAATLAWSLLALLIVWSRRPRLEHAERTRETGGAQLPSTISQVGTAGLLLLLSLVSRQTFSAGPQDNRPPKYSLVFIPYDPAQPEKMREASRVLVPRTTYDRLVELAQSSADAVEPVLIRSSAYAGSVASDRVIVAIDFEIESFTPAAARLSLPLSGLVVRSAELDGKPCLLEPGSQGLALEVPGAGLHKLRVDAVLALDAGASEGSFELKIPPTPAAKLNIELPPDITMELEPATASIEWIKETQRQHLRAELGAVDRLTARWRRGPVTSRELHVDMASLFTWKPTGSRLEVRANVAVESGRTRQVLFELDPKLVLERVRAAGMTGHWIRPSDRPQLVIEFDRPLEKQTLIGLDFLAGDVADPVITVPDVRVTGSKRGIKLVAARAEGAAKLHVVVPKEPTTATVDDFQGLWGEPLPRMPEPTILQLPADPALRLERVPSDDRPVFRSISELRVSTTRVELATQMTCESAAGKNFRHELTLPAELTLTDVRASAETQWRRVAPDRVVWFGSSGGDAAPSIELNGWVPTIAATGPLPVVHPLGDCRLTGELTMWRNRDTRVAILDARELAASEPSRELRPPAPNLILDSHFDVTASDFTAKLKIERLTPKLSATAAGRILIVDSGAEWISVLEFEPSDGPFDRIEFRIPDLIVPPVQIVGNGVFRRDVRREGSDQIWTIHLEEPRWGSYRLVLRARVEPLPSGSIPVPVVHPARVAEFQKYLLVLNASDTKFDVLGIEKQRVVSSDGFNKWFSEPTPRTEVGAFELREPVGRIELQPVRPVRSIAPHTAILERHRCWLRPDGGLLNQSTIFIHARTETAATIAFPESASVIDMEVDGEAIQPSMNADGHVPCELRASDRLHEVRLGWRVEPTRNERSRTRHVELPRLTHDDCPSVWTVLAPPQWQLSSSSAPATSRSLLDATAARAFAEDLERLVESPISADAAQRATVLLHSEARFVSAADAVRRTHDAESEVGLARSEARRDHDRAAIQLAHLERQNRELLDRAGLGSFRARAEAQVSRALLASAAPRTPDERTSAAPPAEASIRRIDFIPQGQPAYFTTESQSLKISFRSAGLTRWLVERVPVALGALLAWGVYLALVRADRHTLATAIALGAIGVVWCWMLRPEPVGPVLILAAMLVALGSLFKRRMRIPAPGLPNQSA
jgi:hypothetical protein